MSGASSRRNFSTMPMRARTLLMFHEAMLVRVMAMALSAAAGLRNGAAVGEWREADDTGRRPSESWGRYRPVLPALRQEDDGPSFRWGDGSWSVGSPES